MMRGALREAVSKVAGCSALPFSAVRRDESMGAMDPSGEEDEPTR
jgi:hypothetical protein